MKQNLPMNKSAEVYGRLLVGHFHNLHNLFRTQQSVRRVNQAAEKLERLYQMTGNADYQYQAMSQRAFAAGHKGSDNLVLKYLSDVTVSDLPALWRLTIYTFKYPVLFNLGEIKGERDIPQEVTRDIDAMSPGLQVSWYEAMALSYARRNNFTGADKNLTIAKKKLEQISNREEDFYFERLIQLARAEIIIASKNRDFRDRGYLAKISHQARKIAHERGFYRFEMEMGEMIGKMS